MLAARPTPPCVVLRRLPRGDQPIRSPGRPPYRSVEITLTTPPSVNGAWVNVIGKGRVRSAEYRAWHNEAGWAIRAARLPMIGGLVVVAIRAALPKRSCDLDNIIKPLLDALTAFAVIEDDSKVARLRAEWAADVRPGCVVVTVRQLSTPEVRCRIAEANRARHGHVPAATEHRAA